MKFKAVYQPTVCAKTFHVTENAILFSFLYLPSSKNMRFKEYFRHSADKSRPPVLHLWVCIVAASHTSY